MKSFCKLAKEAISAKDYNQALSYAESGLISDEALEGEKAPINRYTLMVFKALSLHNLERDQEAIETYENAAMKHPELPLAWQVRFFISSFSTYRTCLGIGQYLRVG